MSRSTRIRFCQNNMLQASGVTLTASGAVTNFPSSNLIDPYRYRQWIPPGTFVITTANQAIYVNDGANKSANIAVGTYTYLTMPAAITTALNGVSSNWECVYDFNGGTFKFSLGRSSGTQILRLSQTTNAVWDTLGYVGSSDVTAYTADQQRNHTSEWVTIDLGVAKAPLGFFVIGAADSLFPISSTATITLKANNINDFTSPAIARTLTADGTGIFHWLDDLTSTNYRYWKWEFQDRLNPVGPQGFAMNIAYLGDYVTPVASNVADGFTRQQVDNSIRQLAVSGARYSRVVAKRWRFDSMLMQNLTITDRVALEAAYSQLGTSTPFFLAVDPTLAISQSAGEMTKYVTFESIPQASHQFYQYFQHGFAAVEEV